MLSAFVPNRGRRTPEPCTAGAGSHAATRPRHRAAAAGSNGQEPGGAVRCHFGRRLYFSTRAPGLSFPCTFFVMHNVQGMLQRQNIHEGDITVVLRPVWNMGKMSCSCVFSIKLNWFLKFLHDSREILTFQTDLECYFLINLRLTCLSGFVPSVLFTAYIIANISVLRDGIFILRNLF